LDVVPGGAGTVSLVQGDGLRIPFVTLVVSASVAEVDPAEERHILLTAPPPDEDELLVVGAETADPLVGKHLATRFVHDAADVGVLLFGIALLVRMRSPDQRSDVDPSAGGLGQDRPQFRACTGQSLAGVASPVEEPHVITWCEAAQLRVKLAKIGGAMDQGRSGVSLSPAEAIPPAPVDRRGRVAALLGAQQPVRYRHVSSGAGARASGWALTTLLRGPTRILLPVHTSSTVAPTHRQGGPTWAAAGA
jgi:hypothetical protein